jgi:hypothetical protein
VLTAPEKIGKKDLNKFPFVCLKISSAPDLERKTSCCYWEETWNQASGPDKKYVASFPGQDKVILGVITVIPVTSKSFSNILNVCLMYTAFAIPQFISSM